MSEETIDELNLLLKKAKPDPYMGLVFAELQEIKEKSKNLRFEEKAKLLEKFFTASGSILYDAVGLLEANIRLDDRFTDASKSRPLAYLEFTDGYRSRVEVIDILESVRNDATLIGHPVVVFAVNYWQGVLVREKYYKEAFNPEKYHEDSDLKVEQIYFNDYYTKFYKKYVDSARRNLKALGKALLEGPRRQSIPKELAFSFKLSDLNINSKNTFLYAAWDRLGKEYIDQTDEPEARIKKIEKFLKTLPTEFDLTPGKDLPKTVKKYGLIEVTISISSVINFLRSDRFKFVYSEEKDISLRPGWVTFKSAFIQWHYKMKGKTVSIYKRKSKKQRFDEELYLSPVEIMTQPESVYDTLYNLLTSPLVKLRDPIECPASKVDLDNLAVCYRQMDTE